MFHCRHSFEYASLEMDAVRSVAVAEPSGAIVLLRVKLAELIETLVERVCDGTVTEKPDKRSNIVVDCPGYTPNVEMTLEATGVASEARTCAMVSLLPVETGTPVESDM
jgi:hypothetical protein